MAEVRRELSGIGTRPAVADPVVGNLASAIRLFTHVDESDAAWIGWANDFHTAIFVELAAALGPMLWAMTDLTAAQRRDLMEIIDDRHDRGSIILATQVPVDRWHATIGDPTYADAILDRIVHNAIRIQLTGESRRKPETNGEASPVVDARIDTPK